jgi:hypothetical protein
MSSTVTTPYGSVASASWLLVSAKASHETAVAPQRDLRDKHVHVIQRRCYAVTSGAGDGAGHSLPYGAGANVVDMTAYCRLRDWAVRSGWVTNSSWETIFSWYFPLLLLVRRTTAWTTN